ncbi:hypothetical protein L1887_17841 [Cichorium endivia]|nr:hypothetical protein L1887_17841 [Cichorium endivia]
MDHKVQEFIVVEVSTRVRIDNNGIGDASGLLVDASGFCMSMFRRIGFVIKVQGADRSRSALGIGTDSKWGRVVVGSRGFPGTPLGEWTRIQIDLSVDIISTCVTRRAGRARPAAEADGPLFLLPRSSPAGAKALKREVVAWRRKMGVSLHAGASKWLLVHRVAFHFRVKVFGIALSKGNSANSRKRLEIAWRTLDDCISFQLRTWTAVGARESSFGIKRAEYGRRDVGLRRQCDLLGRLQDYASYVSRNESIASREAFPGRKGWAKLGRGRSDVLRKRFGWEMIMDPSMIAIAGVVEVKNTLVFADGCLAGENENQGYRRSFLYDDERRVCVKFSVARGVTWMYMIFEGIIGDLAGKELGMDKWKDV